MALLDFPTGPQNNDTYTLNGNTWKWNGTSWVAFNNLSLTSQVTGVLATQYGGTGKALSSLTIGSVLYADTSSSFAALAPGTNNYVLATQGSGSPPYWKVDDSGTGSVGSGITGGFAYYTGLNNITSGSGFSLISGSGNGGTVIFTNGQMALIGSTIISGTWAGSAITLTYGGTNNNISGIGHSYRVAIFDFAGTAITNISSAGTASSVLFQASQDVSPKWIGQAQLFVGAATTAGSATTTANIYAGGAGSIPYNSTANTTTFLTHSGAGNSILVTYGSTSIGWTSPANVSVGSATNATNATNTAITDDTSTSSAQYITWVGSNSGNQPQKVTSTKLTFTPSTGKLDATSFSGSGLLLSGIITSLSTTAGSGIILSASTGPVTIANIGVTSISGTANQISATASTGIVTLSLPQSISTTSSPSFADITLTTGTNSTLASMGSQGTSLVNKQYVDNLASGLDIHGSVRAVLTTGIGGSYVQNQIPGSSAIGASIVATTNGAFPTIDGVTFSATGVTQRILIAGGATGKTNINSNLTWGTPTNTNLANGIYYVFDLGSAGSKWILVRATDTDDNTELTGGTFTFVEEGSTYADTGWVCTNDTTNFGPIQLGLDNANTGAINFSQFSGAATFTAGQGLSKVGSTFATVANIATHGTYTVGVGFTAFTIGGALSGIAGTTFNATLRVGSTVANGSGTAAISLNTVGFSMTGGTQTVKGLTVIDDMTLSGAGNSLTLTGSISLPQPTQYGIAYGSSALAMAFTAAASGSGASVLTQTLNNNPVYLGQSQLFVGAATTAGSATTTANIYAGGAGSIPYNTASSTTTFLSHSGSASSVLVTTATGIGWTVQGSLFVGSATTAGSATTTANIYAGGAGSIPYNTASSTTTFLNHSGAGNSILVTYGSTAIGWTASGNVTVGNATNATNLNLSQSTGLGTSYLVFAGGQSGNQPTYTATGITVSAQSSAIFANNLVATGLTIATSSSTGALIVAGGVGIGGSLWTATANYSQVSGIGLSNSAILSGRWAGSAVSLPYGGTNNTVSGNGWSSKVAVYNESGTAITALTHVQGSVIFGATGGTYASLASTSIPVAAISDSAPARPGGAIGNTQPGALWWDSQYGVLKIYYSDVDTSQWVDATPVLGSSGGGSSTKRSYVMTFGAGFTPSTGADTVQIVVPYAPDNTSKFYYIKRLDYRNETSASGGGAGVSFYIDRHTDGNASFAVANRIHTVGAGAAGSFIAAAGAFTTSYVLAGSGLSFASSSGVAASIISGDYLRLNFTALNSAATLSVSMMIEEQ